MLCCRSGPDRKMQFALDNIAFVPRNGSLNSRISSGPSSLDWLGPILLSPFPLLFIHPPSSWISTEHRYINTCYLVQRIAIQSENLFTRLVPAGSRTLSTSWSLFRDLFKQSCSRKGQSCSGCPVDRSKANRRDPVTDDGDDYS